jgi:hypothetical protein
MRLRWANSIPTFFRRRQAASYSGVEARARATSRGLVFAFVLIQEKFAPLISDTMFVPGYFHFFAVGVNHVYHQPEAQRLCISVSEGGPAEYPICVNRIGTNHVRRDIGAPHIGCGLA